MKTVRQEIITTAARAEIFEEIETERLHQDTLFGPDFDDQNTANDWAVYLLRYTANTCEFNVGIENWRRQMIKVAAIAVAALEAAERNGQSLPQRHNDDSAGEEG